MTFVGFGVIWEWWGCGVLVMTLPFDSWCGAFWRCGFWLFFVFVVLGWVSVVWDCWVFV